MAGSHLRRPRGVLVLLSIGCAVYAMAALSRAQDATPRPVAGAVPPLFSTAETCAGCHGDLVSPRGEDVSFDPHWRSSMMANSARDPYWQAAVRREMSDHAHDAALIEDECSICHMPAARYEARANGLPGVIFAHLPAGKVPTASSALAADGVTCSVCHQVTSQELGDPASFTGGFHVDTTRGPGQRTVFGPYDVDPGRARVMQSAVGFVPAKGTHLQESDMCGTCHTLFTQAYGPNGEVVGRLPEQTPYLEWRHSEFRETRSCQSCHMPAIEEDMPISSVLGQPRSGVSRHTFLGGNFFMMRLLNRYRGETRVSASPHELGASAARTIEHLQSEAAVVSLGDLGAHDGTLVANVVLENLGGHKLPTAYPSRRAWVHLAVRDANGALVFESGRVTERGSIAGNDNDANAAAYEPHHLEISRPDQVQIYESILVDHAGRVTTGLLSGTRYAKDNRLLPKGFSKSSAPAAVAVYGSASHDDDFVAGKDRVRYVVSLGDAPGPYRVEAELLYQPIGYRWADNLRAHDSAEAKRFTSYFDSLASTSSVALARAVASVDARRLDPARPTGTKGAAATPPGD